MNANRDNRALLTALLTAVASGTGSLQAGLVASNADVPNTMDAGGTASDPAIYRYDNYTPPAPKTVMRVGQTKSYNRLEVVNASAFTVANTSWSGGDKVIGYTSGTGHNSVLVSGAGSSLTVGTGGTSFFLGYQSDHNSLTIEQGATLTSLGTGVGGNNNNGEATRGGSYNSLTIDGATANGNQVRVGMYSGSAGNRVIVRNGGKLTASRLYVGLDSAAYPGSRDNDVTVDGFGSWIDAPGYLNVGTSVAGTNNTLTIVNQGLVKHYYAYGRVTVAATGGNYVRLAAGYLAELGNYPNALLDAQVRVWNGSAWVPGAKNTNWTATYYSTEAAALAATGYSGLNGYTVFAGGQPWSPSGPPPNPATIILIR